MNIDEQLETYRKELELAENKLDALVKSAEQEIATAYHEFNAHLGAMTSAVRKLTAAAPRGGRPGTMVVTPDPQTTPH